MTHMGGCHCGAIRYRIDGEAKNPLLCHCRDCRLSAGAPVVAWVGVDEGALTITDGAPREFNSSGKTMRSFCANCGTGLFWRNTELLPGVVEVQTATLDDPEAFPPAMQVQTAERIGWMKTAHGVPAFERWPE